MNNEIAFTPEYAKVLLDNMAATIDTMNQTIDCLIQRLDEATKTEPADSEGQ